MNGQNLPPPCARVGTPSLATGLERVRKVGRDV